MATSLSTIQTEFEKRVRFQKTPIPFTSDDYFDFVVNGAKRLYIDLGYSGWDDDFDEENKVLARDLTVSEIEYTLVAAEISFINQIKANVAQLVSYTTDALSITHADKPYANLQSDLTILESRLSEVFYKITSGVGTVNE